MELTGDTGKARGGEARDGLGKVEERRVLALAEVLGEEEFRQADDLGAARGSLTNVLDGTLQVLLRRGGATHLHQAHGKLVGGHWRLPGNESQALE